MRLFLDESLPRDFGRGFAEDDVSTVKQLGWAGLTNGALLAAAAEAGFDALLTPDKGFEFQQNIKGLPLTVVILRAQSTRLSDLEPLVATTRLRLQNAKPKTLIVVRPKERRSHEEA